MGGINDLHKHDRSTAKAYHREKGSTQRKEFIKPKCSIEYNKHMAGVDRVDQMIAYCPCTRKTIKLTKKVFFYLMEMTMSNARILYNLCQPDKKDHLSLHSFQQNVIDRKYIMDENSGPSISAVQVPLPRRPRGDPDDRRRGGLFALIPTTARKSGPQQSCKLCRRRGKRKDTRLYCMWISLCMIPCFNEYHTLKHMWFSLLNICDFPFTLKHMWFPFYLSCHKSLFLLAYRNPLFCLLDYNSLNSAPVLWPNKALDVVVYCQQIAVKKCCISYSNPPRDCVSRDVISHSDFAEVKRNIIAVDMKWAFS